MEDNKNPLTRQEVESAIVDLTADIMDIEQRLQEEISEEEFSFWGQQLASRYEELDDYNKMLSTTLGSSTVENFREYSEAKKQPAEKKFPDVDYMGE